MRQHEYKVQAGVEGACARLVAAGAAPASVARALAAILADCALDEEEPPFSVDVVPAAHERGARGVECKLRVSPSGVTFIGDEPPRRLDELQLIVMLGGAFQPASVLERARHSRSRAPSPHGSLGSAADEEEDQPYGVQLRWLDGHVHTLRARPEDAPGEGLAPARGADEAEAGAGDDAAGAVADAAEQLQEFFEAHLVRFAHMRGALLLSLRRACAALEPADEPHARDALGAALAAVWAPLAEAAAEALGGGAALAGADSGRDEAAGGPAALAARLVGRSGAPAERMALLGLGAETDWAPLLAPQCQHGAVLLAALGCLAQALSWARANGQPAGRLLAALALPDAAEPGAAPGADSGAGGHGARPLALGAAAVFLACAAMQAAAVLPPAPAASEAGGGAPLPGATQLLAALSWLPPDDDGAARLGACAQRPARELAAVIAARGSAVLGWNPLTSLALLCAPADVTVGDARGGESARAQAAGDPDGEGASAAAAPHGGAEGAGGSGAAPPGPGLLAGLFACALELFLELEAAARARAAGARQPADPSAPARALAQAIAHVGSALAPPSRGAARAPSAGAADGSSGSGKHEAVLSLAAVLARLRAAAEAVRRGERVDARLPTGLPAGSPAGAPLGTLAGAPSTRERGASAVHFAVDQPEREAGLRPRALTDGAVAAPLSPAARAAGGEANAVDGDADGGPSGDMRTRSLSAPPAPSSQQPSPRQGAQPPSPGAGAELPIAQIARSHTAPFSESSGLEPAPVPLRTAQTLQVLPSRLLHSPMQSMPGTPGGSLSRRPSGGADALLSRRPSAGAPPSAAPPFNFALQHGSDVEAELRGSAEVFNAASSGRHGVRQLVERGLLDGSPEETSAFFRRAGARLRQNHVADFLGSDGSEEALTLYVDSLQVAGLRLDSAMRKLNTSIQLRVEAQKLDRILSVFAKRYHESNPGLFVSEERAYITAYSLLMLNTDAHNEKVRNKMSVEGFIAMNRTAAGEAELPRELLEALYENVTGCDLQVEERSQAEVVKEGWLLKQNRRVGWKWRYCLLSSRALYIFKQKEDATPAFFYPLEYSAISQVQQTGALCKKLEIRSVVEAHGAATPRVSRSRSANGGSRGPVMGRTMVMEAMDERSAREWLRAVQQFTLQSGILVVPPDALAAWERQQAAAAAAALDAAAAAAGAEQLSAPPSPRASLPLLLGADPAGEHSTGAPGEPPSGDGGAGSAGAPAPSSLRERRARHKQLHHEQRALRISAAGAGGAVAPAAGDAAQLVCIERFYEAMEQAGGRSADASDLFALPPAALERGGAAGQAAAAAAADGGADGARGGLSVAAPRDAAGASSGGAAGGAAGDEGDAVDGAGEAAAARARLPAAPPADGDLPEPAQLGVPSPPAVPGPPPPITARGGSAGKLAAPARADDDDAPARAADDNSSQSSSPSPRRPPARPSGGDGGDASGGYRRRGSDGSGASNVSMEALTGSRRRSSGDLSGGGADGGGSAALTADGGYGGDASGGYRGDASGGVGLAAEAEWLLGRRLLELRLLEAEVPAAAAQLSARERASLSDESRACKQRQLDELDRALASLDAALAERTAALRAVSAQVSAERESLAALVGRSAAAAAAAANGQRAPPDARSPSDLAGWRGDLSAAQGATAEQHTGVLAPRLGPGAGAGCAPPARCALSIPAYAPARHSLDASYGGLLHGRADGAPPMHIRADVGAGPKLARSAAELRAATSAPTSPAGFDPALHALPRGAKPLPFQPFQPAAPTAPASGPGSARSALSGADAATLLRAGASAGLPARLARLVCAGSRFNLLAETPRASGAGAPPQPALSGAPIFVWVSPALDLLQWAHEEAGADACGAATPSALVRTVQRGGWLGAPGSAGSTADPYSGKNCAWQFSTEGLTVCLLAQDNAQREDWVTALTLISKAAARGMLLPGGRAAR